MKKLKTKRIEESNKVTALVKRIEFPSRVIAFINIEPEELTNIRSEIKFSVSHDDLDYIKLSYFQVKSGKTYGLMKHKNNPDPGTEILASRHSCDLQNDIREVLTHFNLPEDVVRWIGLGIDENSKEKLRECNLNLIHSYNNRGLIYHNLNQLEKALSDYFVAIKLANDYNKKEINDELAGLYNNRGRVYSDLCKFKEALDDYNAAIELKKDLAVPYNNRAEVFYKLGKFKEAIEDCNQAIELDSNVAEFYNSLGVIYFNIKNINEAIINFEKAIMIDPNLSDAEHNINIAKGLLAKKLK